MKITIEELEVLFNSSNLEEIAAKYKKSELQNMYYIAYGLRPRTSFRKNDIVQSIWDYFCSIKRTKDLSKNL